MTNKQILDQAYNALASSSSNKTLGTDGRQTLLLASIAASLLVIARSVEKEKQ